MDLQDAVSVVHLKVRQYLVLMLCKMQVFNIFESNCYFVAVLPKPGLQAACHVTATTFTPHCASKKTRLDYPRYSNSTQLTATQLSKAVLSPGNPYMRSCAKQQQLKLHSETCYIVLPQKTKSTGSKIALKCQQSQQIAKMIQHIFHHK